MFNYIKISVLCHETCLLRDLSVLNLLHFIMPRISHLLWCIISEDAIIISVHTLSLCTLGNRILLIFLLLKAGVCLPSP